MCITHSSPYGGSPSQRPHWTKTPLDKDLPGQRPPGQRPPVGTWDQAARQELTSYRERPVDRVTDTRL